MRRRFRLLARASILPVMLMILGGAAMAESAPPAPDGFTAATARRVTADDDTPMLVRADEMIYDNDNETVTAAGSVQIYYDGRVLQADRVVYDRRTGRVRASGNVVITEPDGTISNADFFDLTDDFRDGFVDSMRVRTPDRTRFAAARAERTDGNVTLFENGVYTACEPCKDNPEKPPFWQVKAKRIIHNDQEKMVYFEDARLEFLGVPLAYVPFLSAPDPTVRRKTGVLRPTYFAASEVGFGAYVPYFIALAPNYDLTLTPGISTRQGPLGSVEWRHRTLTGSYSILGSGVFQADPGAFPDPPDGPGEREFRGALETTGEFWLSEKTVFGWDATLLSDRYYLEDYNFDGNAPSEAISTLYLTGKGSRSWLDARFYYFLALTNEDIQAEQPIVAPVIDYDYVLDRPVFGGELGWNVNATNLTRQQAEFDQIAGNAACDGLSVLSTPREDCIERGIAGTYSRLSAALHWRRQIVDPIGQLWTPFAYLRGDITWAALDADTPVQFVNDNNEALARGIPAIGLDYRYPLVANMAWGSHMITPIGQIILRPPAQHAGDIPNEDAQSLVFDETTLFEWDKFSGYDRIEDDSRINYGFQYLLTTNDGFAFNAIAGQSLVLGSHNAFDEPDMANTGQDSGLETQVSDFVAGLQAQFAKNGSLFTRMRFNQDDLGIARLEAGVNGTLGRLGGTATYGRYEAQPALGLDEREGVAANASLRVTDRWSISGSAVYDIDAAQMATTTAGLLYQDECTTMSVLYSRDFSDSGNDEPSSALMVQLSLRTLGGVGYSQSLGSGSETASP